MQVMHRLRSYHAILAILVVLAYATGGNDRFHAWLGYGVAAIILIRLAWALTGVAQLGLIRFYPHFEGLRLASAMTHPAISRTLLLGIAMCLVAVSLTGIAMDRGYSVGAGDQAIKPATVTHDDPGASHDDDENEDESIIGEAHETSANLLLVLVLTHVAYLVLFKRPLALFMLFSHTPAKGDPSP